MTYGSAPYASAPYSGAEPSSAPAATYFRPSADVSSTDWLPSTGADLYACIDETTANDSDYIYRDVADTGVAVMSLGGTLPVGAHPVRFRGMVTSGTGQIRVKLLNASNAVVGTGSWQSMTTSQALYSETITTTGDATQVQIEGQE